MKRVLRDYQDDAVAAVRREVATRDSTLLVLPTGTGKTIVMARLATEWEGGNVLLLAHRVELLDQAAKKIAPELGYLPVIEQAQRGMEMDCMWQGGQVLVGSVQTMLGSKRLNKFKEYPFDLILIDEAHHATSASYRRVIDYFRGINPRCKVVGVTATPRRSDDTALGIVFDSVAYHMAIYDAIQLGWLVPIEQEYVTVEDVDFSGIPLGRNEMGESDLKASDLEEVLVEEQALHSFARPILDKSAGRSGIVFTAGVAHAEMLAAVLCRYKDGCARAISGKTETKERNEAVAAFHSGGLQYLVNCQVLVEGFDSHRVGVVAMARPTKSESVYAQMLGRATRTMEGIVDGLAGPEERVAAIAASAKPHALVLDFVGNSRHKLISAVDILGGNYDVEVRELARQRMARQPGDVMVEMEKAKALLLLDKEQQRRKVVKASVAYGSQKIDPFGNGATPGAQEVEVTRGGSSDAQIGFLVNLGVDHATAAKYTRRQASAVIEKLKDTRCTRKQAAILEKHGFNAGVSFEGATEIINQIAASGWRLRGNQLQEAQ